jgi:anti-sigma factor ChrR (cupin superfamily)
MTSPHPAPRIITLHPLPWEELMPGIMRKRIWSAPMWNDPGVSRDLSMVRYEPGATAPMHKHVGDEIVFVIEGVLSDEYGDITAGNVGYRPDGCVHSLRSASGATTLSFLVGGAEMVAQGGADSPRSKTINVNEMPWRSHDDGRLQMKMIWQDPASERQVVLAKLAPGFIMAPHEHVGEELVFQIEGAVAENGGVLAPGDVSFRPFGCRHAFASPNGAVSLGYLWGHSKPLDGAS